MPKLATGVHAAGAVAEAHSVKPAMTWGALGRALQRVEDLRQTNPEVTCFMEFRAANTGEPVGKLHSWCALQDVSGFLLCSTIHAEDPLFFRHHGFWWSELRWQIWIALRERRRVAGVSTITQQLARNLFLVPTRSLKRKFFEALLSAQLEDSIPKTRLLEIYLNVVEFGPRVWGVGVASEYWLDTPCEAVGPFGAAVLASLLPAPRAHLSDRNARRALHAQRRLTGLLYGSGMISLCEERATYSLIDALERSIAAGAEPRGTIRQLASEERAARAGRARDLSAAEALRRECGVPQRGQYESYVRRRALYLRGITQWPEYWSAPPAGALGVEEGASQLRRVPTYS